MTEDLDELLSLLLGASQEICSCVEQDIAKAGRHIENKLSQKCDNVLEFQSPDLPCEALQPARISRTLRKVAELGDRIRENRRARPRARSQQLTRAASDSLAETNVEQLQAQESEQSKGIQLPEQAVQKAKAGPSQGGLSRADSTCSTADTPMALGSAAGHAPSRLASMVSSSKPSLAQEPPRRPVGSRPGSNARCSITAGEAKTARMSGRNVMDMVRQFEVKQQPRQSAAAGVEAQLQRKTTSSSVEDPSPVVTAPELEAKLLADEHGHKESIATSKVPQGSVDEPVSSRATSLEMPAPEASVSDVKGNDTVDQEVEICDSEARRSQEETCKSNALSGAESSAVHELHSVATKDITASGVDAAAPRVTSSEVEMQPRVDEAAPEQPRVDAAAPRVTSSEVEVLASALSAPGTQPCDQTAPQPEEEPLAHATAAASDTVAPVSSCATTCGTEKTPLEATELKVPVFKMEANGLSDHKCVDAAVPASKHEEQQMIPPGAATCETSAPEAAEEEVLVAPTTHAADVDVPTSAAREETALESENSVSAALLHAAAACASTPQKVPTAMPSKKGRRSAAFCMEMATPTPMLAEKPDGKAQVEASTPSTQPAAAPAHSSEPLGHDATNSMSPQRRACDSSQEKASPSKSFEAWQVLRQIKLPPPDPADNYEISDQADSDADENLLAERRSRKPKPRWCVDYAKLLKKQADLDPDTIFGPMMPRCELEEIFPDAMYQEVAKSRPNRRRGSSGNWRKDPLQRSEISAYKRKLGQNRAWADLDSLPAGSHEALPTVFGRRALPTPARASLSSTFEV